jgi:hypothetical protein
MADARFVVDVYASNRENLGKTKTRKPTTCMQKATCFVEPAIGGFTGKKLNMRVVDTKKIKCFFV